MHINEILKLKLKEDLLKDLLLKYDKSGPYTKKIYRKLCLKKIIIRLKIFNS